MDIEVNKVEQTDGKYVKGAKRQRIPYEVKWTCPSCETRKTLDWTDRYLSYPVWNEENTEYLYCGECQTEVEVTVVPSIDISLEVEE